MGTPRPVPAVRVAADTMITPSDRPMDPSLRGIVATPVGLHLLATPLDFILAEHMRLRALCAMLRHFAGEAAIAADRAIRDTSGRARRFMGDSRNWTGGIASTTAKPLHPRLLREPTRTIIAPT